jgi:hypothetical protein
MIRDSSFHSRRDVDLAMNSAEVVKGEPQTERSSVVLPLLAEAVRESSESPGGILAIRSADRCCMMLL